MVLFFFFQAEDGIRDLIVTGVQTCALPIFDFSHVVGVLDTDDVRKINYLPIFFVAAAVSLSNVLAQTKALDVLTSALFAWMTPHITSVWSSTMVLYWSAFVYHIVIGNEIAMLSTSLPILMKFA